MGQGLHIHEVSRSHTTTRHSRQDYSGRVISPSQRPLPDNTQHTQQTDINVPGGIRTHKLSRRAATDVRLRPRGRWDRQFCPLSDYCTLYNTRHFVTYFSSSSGTTVGTVVPLPTAACPRLIGGLRNGPTFRTFDYQSTQSSQITTSLTNIIPFSTNDLQMNRIQTLTL